MKVDGWIETYTGLRFNPFNSSCEEISINDIAHSLSLQCRYAGHCNRFYSIAEHSILVSENCSKENQLWGLLHDASEAYITDIPRPIKQYLSQIKDLEDHVLKLIAEKFDLGDIKIPEEVKWIDTVMLRTESIQLMRLYEEWVIRDIEPLPITLECWSPLEVEERFLDRFCELFSEE